VTTAASSQGDTVSAGHRPAAAAAAATTATTASPAALPAGSSGTGSAARTPAGATTRTARARTNHPCRNRVIRILLAADHHGIADFEVRNFSGLAILAELGLRRQLDGHSLPVRTRDINRTVADGSDFSEERSGSAFAPFCLPWTLLRWRAGWSILRLRQSYAHDSEQTEKKKQSDSAIHITPLVSL